MARTSAPINRQQQIDEPWHQLGRDEVAEKLGSSRERGLSEQEAKARLEKYGPNRLEEAPPKSFAVMLWEQLNNFVVYLLFAAAIISMVLGEWIEAGDVIAEMPQHCLQGDWDADRLTQVVSNLLGNAIQHGGATPVTVTAGEDGDAVTLAVHNGGAPVSPEALPFIFEPLARGQSENTKGSRSIGLGLFIARAIVSAHGGHIDVTSSSDDGTMFTVWLPKAAAS